MQNSTSTSLLCWTGARLATAGRAGGEWKGPSIPRGSEWSSRTDFTILTAGARQPMASSREPRELNRDGGEPDSGVPPLQ